MTPATWRSNQGVDGLIPLTIGAIGHRDLREEDLPQLRSEVERFFDSLDEAYPNTPRRCFTGLASGADQLIAAIAIRRGIAVTVVLPALPEAFRSTLDSSSDRETFDDLFKKAFDVIILPNIATPAEVDESPVSIHDKQYAALGNFLSDRSEILLALFDGNTFQEKLGGTAWIVRRKREGRDRAGAEWLDLPQTGLVYSIPVRRKSDEAWPSDEPRYQLCEGEKLSTYQDAFREIDLFNKRARDISVTRLHSLQNVANELDRVQLIADLLAIKWKEKITLSRRTLFACAVVMFFSYLAYANFIPTLQLIVLYLSAQTVGAVIWFMQRSSRAHKNYVMYRTFCEALRVLQAWRDGGIKESSFRHFQRKHYSHLRWIRLAIRALESNEQLLRTAVVEQGTEASGNLVTDGRSPQAQWIIEESRFFEKSVREKHRNVRIVSVVTGVSNLLGLSATAAAVILTVSASHPVALQIAVVAMAAFPGFSALINAFASREGWHDDINQYRHMSYMFERAQNIWNRDEISKHHLVFELGRELLHHNGDWLSASLSRPLEPPL